MVQKEEVQLRYLLYRPGVTGSNAGSEGVMVRGTESKSRQACKRKQHPGRRINGRANGEQQWNSLGAERGEKGEEGKESTATSLRFLRPRASCSGQGTAGKSTLQPKCDGVYVIRYFQPGSGECTRQVPEPVIMMMMMMMMIIMTSYIP